MNSEKKRTLYLDYLRVIALLGTIVLHTSVIDWQKHPVQSFNWQVFNMFDSCVRFCVPIFVMISGALFLDPDRKIEIKRFFTHNVLRIITSFAFWTILYAILSTLMEENNMIDGSVKKYFFASIIYGHYHMWFLFAIFGLYLITPLLRKITEHKELTEYFIVLTLIFSFIPNALSHVPVVNEPVGKIYGKVGMYFVAGYVGYYVIGFYLHKYEINKTLKSIIYILAIAGLIITVAGNSIASVKAGAPLEVFYDYMLPNVLFVSAGLFVFVKNIIKRSNIKESTVNRITHVSRLSYGIYLIHDVFIMIFKYFGLSTTIITPVIMIPVTALIILGAGYVITLGISKIPVLNKYII